MPLKWFLNSLKRIFKRAEIPRLQETNPPGPKELEKTPQTKGKTGEKKSCKSAPPTFELAEKNALFSHYKSKSGDSLVLLNNRRHLLRHLVPDNWVGEEHTPLKHSNRGDIGEAFYVDTLPVDGRSLPLVVKAFRQFPIASADENNPQAEIKRIVEARKKRIFTETPYGYAWLPAKQRIYMLYKREKGIPINEAIQNGLVGSDEADEIRRQFDQNLGELGMIDFDRNASNIIVHRLGRTLVARKVDFELTLRKRLKI